jgi:hypothetical protein
MEFGQNSSYKVRMSQVKQQTQENYDILNSLEQKEKRNNR